MDLSKEGRDRSPVSPRISTPGPSRSGDRPEVRAAAHTLLQLQKQEQEEAEIRSGVRSVVTREGGGTEGGAQIPPPPPPPPLPTPTRALPEMFQTHRVGTPHPGWSRVSVPGQVAPFGVEIIMGNPVIILTTAVPITATLTVKISIISNFPIKHLHHRI